MTKKYQCVISRKTSPITEKKHTMGVLPPKNRPFCPRYEKTAENRHKMGDRTPLKTVPKPSPFCPGCYNNQPFRPMTAQTHDDNTRPSRSRSGSGSIWMSFVS